MNKEMSSMISKWDKAVKHCDKVINECNKRGSAIIKIGCTGVELVCKKDSPIYLNILEYKYKLLGKLQSIKVVEEKSSSLLAVKKNN